nr:alpha-E domain-containing protein [Thermoproteota archaeon]
MNYVIHSHIIYYVEPIGICHENLLLLLLLSDARSQEEEENTQFAGEQIALQKEVDGVTAVPVAGKEPPAATATTATERGGSAMLSRIAEALFWIGRYVERADDTARILDVHYHLLLEDPWIEEESACRAL